MKGIKEWFARRRAMKAHDAGFEYALSVLRGETDPELHKQLREQAAGDDAFCQGMTIAINGWKPDADLIDVMKWAEEYMATKEPVTPHQVSEAAEEAGRRMGYESFRYTEAS